MGQGSRGGNGGVTSSGGRMREDKALKEAEKKPRTVPKEKENKPGDKNKKQDNQGGQGGRGGRGGRGRGGLRLFRFPHFRGSGSKGGSKSSGSGSKKSNIPASNIQNKNKIPTIKRVQGPKVKLTKQRGNKAPN